MIYVAKWFVSHATLCFGSQIHSTWCMPKWLEQEEKSMNGLIVNICITDVYNNIEPHSLLSIRTHLIDEGLYDLTISHQQSQCWLKMQTCYRLQGVTVMN